MLVLYTSYQYTEDIGNTNDVVTLCITQFKILYAKPCMELVWQVLNVGHTILHAHHSLISDHTLMKLEVSLESPMEVIKNRVYLNPGVKGCLPTWHSVQN